MSSREHTTFTNKTLNPQVSSSSTGRPSHKRTQAYNVASLGLDLVANVAEASDILAPLKAACRATKTILDVMLSINDNHEDWINLAQRLKEYTSSLEEQVALFEADPLKDTVVNNPVRRPLILYAETLDKLYILVANLKEKPSRSKFGFLRAISKVKIDAGEIRRLNQEIEDRHRQFMNALGLFTALHVQTIEQNTKTTKANVETLLTDVDANAILQLPMVAFAASSVHTPCLQGTRQAVLEAIWRWAADDMSDKPIFWLCDIAGSGKSSVAMSTVASWRAEGLLGGQFFFSMASADASTTEKFCSTMAKEIAHHIPELAPQVAKAVKRHPAIMRSPFGEQFRTLVTGPLHHRQQRVIFVLDAIDECKSGSQRKELIDTLAAATRETPNLKTVLQQLSIKYKLEDRLHDVKHPDNISDIAIYIHHSLYGILPQDKRQRLVEKANGLFIWASTACRMLTSKFNLSSPEDTYDRLISMNQTGVIDDVYDLVFERTNSEQGSILCAMLALLVAAFEPLDIGDLEDLLKHARVRGSAKALVQTLGSVLVEDQKTGLIHFRHPTLVEYLRRRCVRETVDTTKKVFIDIANAHGQAASWCLKCLQSPTDGLKFNICQLESSFYLNRDITDLGARVSKFISRRLRYASSHWLFHMARTNDDWQHTLNNGVIYVIQSPHVLYWIEILSVTGGVTRAIAGLRGVTGHRGLAEETRRSMTEIRRFIMAFLVPIRDSAPHIYISALPFTPKQSKLHIEGLKVHSNTLVVTQGLEEAYPGLPRALESHIASIYTVAFSPDGSRIVSGSKDSGIQLWDADTGQPLGRPFKANNGFIHSVAFSPDGSRIVSGSDNTLIRLWDADTGQPWGEPLRGHTSTVYAVEFSPDGLRIVSCSADATIRIWDADTGQPLGDPLRGHASAVNDVTFSPDGRRIVSCSEDKTIRLWDAHTGQPLGEPLYGHESVVYTVAFSPDGSQIVSGSGPPLLSRSGDCTIRVWDSLTGRPLGDPLRGHSCAVRAVVFSPDGSKIVSASGQLWGWDNTIRLWDVATGRPLREPLRGHKSCVSSVAFSPDGSQIVSGSWDATIRLWDACSGQPLGEPSQGHESNVNAIAFSPDGSQIVSGSGTIFGSSENTIRLWNAATGQPLGEPFRHHQRSVNAVAFSPDGTRVASGSEDKTIRVWDAVTGQSLGEPLQGHEESVKSVVFSPDGLRIVSGSLDQTGHEGSVNAVGFSPDGLRIVSGSHDKTVRLWDAVAGRPLGEPLRGHERDVYSVSFSPDGSQIVSGSEDHTIRLWNAHTGQPLGEPLHGHTSGVLTVAFAPDTLRLVSGSRDHSIRLWDVVTRQPFGKPLQGHEGSVNAVAFSPDGSQIVSGSNDKTIRLWNSNTGANVNNSTKDGQEPLYPGLSDELPGIPLEIHIPGFKQCSLLHDGWVQSSGKLLFWA
ncbi:SubName: Full=Related to WD40-repeat protein (Notchless protein) {ECO:0000313/EMBL:CCA73057.1} [Serendipita indica DSM 11827]|nr:SubName: Full=Related to WD40-repeat protein (Notchless protein) {ECO:0000313/EMBL:CCA73057.1} [Serendipita indica DSM 11827]